MTIPKLPAKPVTELLKDWSNGDESARDQIVTSLYAELRKQARGLLRKERPNHTIQPTALVNEAYIKLNDLKSVHFQFRGQFYRLVGDLMRQVLVDYARQKNSAKRGGGQQRISISLVPESAAQGQFVDFLDLNAALTKLEKLHQQHFEVVRLKFFVGLTNEVVAETLNVDKRTVIRKWEFAQAFLLRELDGPEPDND